MYFHPRSSHCLVFFGQVLPLFFPSGRGSFLRCDLPLIQCCSWLSELKHAHSFSNRIHKTIFQIIHGLCKRLIQNIVLVMAITRILCACKRSQCEKGVSLGVHHGLTVPCHIRQPLVSLPAISLPISSVLPTVWRLGA